MNNKTPCRCAWVDLTKPDYVAYHDEEWGVPVYDDKTLFEFLLLESAQAGLNWYTILKRRAGYKRAFANFDVYKVANFSLEDIEKLKQDPTIIRNKAKINSAINNAQCFLNVIEEFGTFKHYIWQFVNHKPIVNFFEQAEEFMTTSTISEQLSKDLKKRGFTFVGPTICYAYMQACGLINDHSVSCYRKKQIINQFKQV
jgi:DNA-3-methyladenine glycosylase I